MNAKRLFGVLPLLLVFLGLASILASLGVVGMNPETPIPVMENPLVTPTISEGNLPFPASLAVSIRTPVNLSSADSIHWEVEVLGRDKLDGREVVVLEFYPVDLNHWRTYKGGKVYRSVEDGSIIALRDHQFLAGNVRERFLIRTDETEEAFQDLPLETLEKGM